LKRINLLSAALAIILPAIILTGGCTRYPSGLERVYSELKEQPLGPGASALKGRIIVIDPGHGGYFDGALGPDSLREADVNLGVALYLWGLLKEAGADVHLTRSTDRDFLPPGSTELKDDLQNRMAIADSFNADVFLSIHHNSNLQLDRKKNGIEVYYKSSDTGASLILAGDVMKHLSKNLSIEKAAVKPGGYFVLRRSNASASILGEASYLSNPIVEKKLKLSNKQRLEAESYFLGLIDYFSRGVPRLERTAPEADTVQSPEPLVFRVREVDGIAVDAASAKIRIASKEYNALYLTDSGELYFDLPPFIPNGHYSIEASVSSILGGIGKSKRYDLTVARPPAFIIPINSPYTQSGSIRLKVLDALGEPVLDGTAVSVSMNDKQSIFETVKGIISVEVGSEQPPARLIVNALNVTDTLDVNTVKNEKEIRIKATNRSSGEAIPGTIAITADNIPIRSGSNGEIHLSGEETSGRLIIYAKGYVPALLDTPENVPERGDVLVSLQPLFDGVLFGKRISIDPASADPVGDGTAEEKTSEDLANLELANALEGLLTAAGASVRITRRGAEPISNEERIFKVNSFKSTIAIRLDHVIPTNEQPAPFGILHYPGSKNGMDLARRIAGGLNRFYGKDAFRVNESARPFLLQTHCPACEILLAPIGSSPGKELVSDNRFIRKESFGIFEAIVRYFLNDSSDLASCTIKITKGGNPAAGVPVTINLVFTKTTDKEGRAHFGAVDVGEIVISIGDKEGRSKTVRRTVTPQGNKEITIELR